MSLVIRKCKITDILPSEAGGGGTDYLMNIEEVSFEGGHVTLVVDSWGWGREELMNFSMNWQPEDLNAHHAQNVATISSGHNHGGNMMGHGNGGGNQGRKPSDANKKWTLYVYKEGGAAVKTTDGKDVYAFGLLDKKHKGDGTSVINFLYKVCCL